MHPHGRFYQLMIVLYYFVTAPTSELKAVALLLGVPYISLFRGLTKKLKVMKSDATIQSCSATQVWCCGVIV